MIAAKVTGEFTTGLDGRNVKLVDSGGGAVTVTPMELVAVCDGDDESIAVSVTVKDCAVVYVWVAVVPVPVAPSSKLQLIAYGAVPPIVVAVYVTGELMIGVEGRNVKLVVGGGGGAPGPGIGIDCPQTVMAPVANPLPSQSPASQSPYAPLILSRPCITATT